MRPVSIHEDSLLTKDQVLQIVKEMRSRGAINKKIANRLNREGARTCDRGSNPRKIVNYHVSYLSQEANATRATKAEAKENIRINKKPANVSVHQDSKWGQDRVFNFVKNARDKGRKNDEIVQDLTNAGVVLNSTLTPDGVSPSPWHVSLIATMMGCPRRAGYAGKGIRGTVIKTGIPKAVRTPVTNTSAVYSDSVTNDDAFSLLEKVMLSNLDKQAKKKLIAGLVPELR